MSDEDIKDCFFVYQVMGDHIDCLTPEGVDSLDEALRLFFANRMWRHCYIEDKNHAQVDISAQIEGFENYLASWDEDGYFDWVEDSKEYMSDDDAEYEEEQRELLNLEYELDDHETDEEWERRQACAWVWYYHPNLDEDAACKMYADFEAFANAGHSFVDALAFSGMQPSNNPAVNYVRRFEPFCSEKDALEKYRVYRSYRDEGQSEIISRQYAGLL